MTPTFDAVVIGGGLAGLAAAAECSSRGMRIAIVEANSHLGGKMNVLRVPFASSGRAPAGTFTFDMGPTIITLPQVLRGIIERSGRRTEDLIDLVDLDPQWRCFYEDGVRIDLKKNFAQMAAALDAQFPTHAPGAGYSKFIEFSRRMYRLSERVFFYKDIGGIGDMMRATPPRDPALLREVMAMRMHSTMAGTAHAMINEPHVRQMVEHFQQYVGSSPFLAPAILSLIAAAQTDHGCWYPRGGTRMVARALETIAREQGVEVFAQARVARISNDGRRATGVELADGRFIRAAHVISNCDVQRTCRDLLDTPRAAARVRSISRSYTPACSGVVLYLGLTRQYPHLAHHDFLFSQDSQREFDDIYTRGVPAEDPTLYLAVPSRTEDEGVQAPPECEALYVLVHTPYMRPGHDWRSADGSLGPMLRSYRETILAKLRRFGMEDIDGHIAVERHLTPNDIDRMYNAEGGAIYGLASHGRLAGGFKPRNRSLVLENLYLAGGSANPGPGVPMVLMSGVTAANALFEDAGMRPVPPRTRREAPWREPAMVS
ncbi:MAG: phytoene desaturase [Phycisphaeraceae bacterium]|nr:phytoene desaturase [Phycisphaeraceae bacterium]